MKIAAVILAAGSSQRMGRAKQLLPVDGAPMLARVTDAVLAAGLDQVVIVLGAGADALAPVLVGQAATIVINRAWSEGIASSLRAGLASVSPECDAVLFVPADMPRLSPAALRAIGTRFEATGKAIVIPTHQGQRGNPVLFARRLFAELAGLQGDRGGRVLFAGHAADIELVEIDDDGILLDVDTPADYERVAGAGTSSS